MSRIGTLSLLMLIGLTGCVSVPTESVTAPVTTEELIQHVTFLTQPALRGRAARSWESVHVRRYLSQRLQTYGCVPWADNPSFELDFGFGKNIIAVLPGSDPVLSKEIVLISAHYDHLKPKWFSYYPGACDNAAAVAVLLEIAENLSQQTERPKRSICFAFFDAEEMGCVGSYAFTCRDDYDNRAIAAAINMDMLGRDLLDVVDNSLIVTGTDDYAPLQKKIGVACADNALKFIPLESDLIGPVGDHTAFTFTGRPVFFFTSGINADYHKTTDTADKINYPKLRREAAVIQRSLLSLADGDEALFAVSPVSVTAAKIQAFATILHQFKKHQDTFKLDPNAVGTLDEIIAAAVAVDPNTLSRQDLIDHQRQALGKLIGLLKNYNKDLSLQSNAFLEISAYYAVNAQALTDIYRQMVRYYLANKPSLFGKNEFACRTFLPVNQNSWGLVPLENGDYLFGYIDTEFSFKNQLQLLTGISYSLMIDCQFTAFRGPLDAILDAAFHGVVDPNGTLQLEMFVTLSLPEDASEYPTGVNDFRQRRSALASLVLETIDQVYPDESASPAVEKLRDPDAMDPNTVTGTERFLIFLTHAKKKSSSQINEKEQVRQFVRLVRDTAQHPGDRANWIDVLAYKKTRMSLTALAELTDDPTPYQRKRHLIGHEQFPLKHHPLIKQHISRSNDSHEKHKDKTLGQIAQENLRRVTKQDFGTDTEAWKSWIDKHY